MRKENTWKIIKYYDGKEDVKEVLVNLYTRKYKRQRKSMEKISGKGYNSSMVHEIDLPGLCG